MRDFNSWYSLVFITINTPYGDRLPIYLPFLGLNSWIKADTQCGAKIFHADSRFWHAIDQKFDHRWIFDVELIHRLIRREGQKIPYRIYEFPLEKWHDQQGSKVKPWDFVGGFWALVRLYLKTPSKGFEKLCLPKSSAESLPKPPS